MKGMNRPSLTARLSIALCLLATYANAAATPQAAAAAGSQTPLSISLDEAIRRAERNEPTFASLAAEDRVQRLERTNARAALLPTATYHNQVLYTQPNGESNRIGQTINQPTPVFIANNSIREYASQGIFNETIGFAQVGAIRVADATAARSTAELEIARRGLVATVVNLYYTVGAQQSKIVTLRQALDVANHFAEITQQREAAREAAHADVLRAQLQQQQRERDVADAQLTVDRARLELAVLLFPDPQTPFTVEAQPSVVPLPDRSSVEALAQSNNPELKSAAASLAISQAETYTAQAALLPDLALNVTYGIDAPQFAVNGPAGIRNLGYSGFVALDIPVWDWLTTERRIKQSRIRTDATRVALTAAQRRLLANLAEFYDEASTAERQLASLAVSIETARESLRLTLLRYQGGEGSVLEVVDAQNAFVTAATAQADGTVRFQLALAQLQTLTGRL